MLKIIIFLILFFQYSDCFAGSKYNSTTGTRDFCITLEDQARSVSNQKCVDVRVPTGQLTDYGSYFLLSAGLANGGATSMTSGQTAVSGSYAFVRKSISGDPSLANGTLTDAILGKVITITITEVWSGGTFTLTPTTKLGFSSVVFDAVGDSVTMVFLDATNGYIIISSNNVTIIT